MIIDNLRWTMTYDGDGVRVKEDYFDGTDTVTTLYFAGGMYEVQKPGESEIITRYYGIAGQRVAMYDGADLEYMLTDAQGSTVVTLNSTGTLLSEQRYMPFGDVRTDIDTVGETDFGYTGQREIEGSELMDYNARFMNPGLARFTQPDTIIPSPANPQSLNRYSYTLNNPIRYTDPTGHKVEEDVNGECGDYEDCELRMYGVTIEGDISDEEYEVIKKAVLKFAETFFGGPEDFRKRTNVNSIEVRNPNSTTEAGCKPPACAFTDTGTIVIRPHYVEDPFNKDRANWNDMFPSIDATPEEAIQFAVIHEMAGHLFPGKLLGDFEQEFPKPEGWVEELFSNASEKRNSTRDATYNEEVFGDAVADYLIDSITIDSDYDSFFDQYVP